MGNIYCFSDGSAYFHHSADASPDPNAFTMHAHEMYEIFYFVSGRASYIVEGNEYRLESGSLMVMRPGEAHRSKIQEGYPYERMALHFSGELLRLIDPDSLFQRPFVERPLGIGNLFPRSRIRSSFVCECLKNIECAGSEPERRLALLANLFPILAEIYRAFSLNGVQAEPETADRMQEVIAYINEHLTEALSLDLLSSRFYLSKPQLGRRFKQATGSSVWDYIVIKRLMRARRMIQNGEKAMQAAQQCGFQDYSAFYRAYRSRYACSPKEEKTQGL